LICAAILVPSRMMADIGSPCTEDEPLVYRGEGPLFVVRYPLFPLADRYSHFSCLSLWGELAVTDRMSAAACNSGGCIGRSFSGPGSPTSSLQRGEVSANMSFKPLAVFTEVRAREDQF